MCCVSHLPTREESCSSITVRPWLCHSRKGSLSMAKLIVELSQALSLGLWPGSGKYDQRPSQKKMLKAMDLTLPSVAVDAEAGVHSDRARTAVASARALASPSRLNQRC